MQQPVYLHLAIYALVSKAAAAVMPLSLDQTKCRCFFFFSRFHQLCLHILLALVYLLIRSRRYVCTRMYTRVCECILLFLQTVSPVCLPITVSVCLSVMLVYLVSDISIIFLVVDDVLWQNETKSILN